MQQITKKIIVYDIANKKRLQRCHRLCTQYAIYLQNSVFLYNASTQHWKTFLHQLQNTINPSQDALWIFETDQSHYAEQLGQTTIIGISIKDQPCQNAIII